MDSKIDINIKCDSLPPTKYTNGVGGTRSASHRLTFRKEEQQAIPPIIRCCRLLAAEALGVGVQGRRDLSSTTRKLPHMDRQPRGAGPTSFNRFIFLLGSLFDYVGKERGKIPKGVIIQRRTAKGKGRRLFPKGTTNLMNRRFWLGFAVFKDIGFLLFVASGNAIFSTVV